MHTHRIILLTCLIMLLCSCAVGPDYVRPPAIVATKFKEAKGKKVIGVKSKNWKVAKPQDDINRGEWWKIFNDPKLNELEARLNHSNQSLINAYENYQQARALVDEARSSFFPTLIGSLSISRQKQGSGSTSFVSSSSTGTSSGTASTGGVPGSASGSRSIITTHTILFNATWEPDIWGLVRRTVEASAAGAQASAALFWSTRLSSQALLAQDYFELRGADAMQKLLDDTVTVDKKILKLTRYQYQSGVVARASVVQAQSTLEAAQALAINNGIVRAQYEHAIAVLIGVTPDTFSLSRRPLKATPPPIPLVVPSSLLERRPDIAQAERLMAQANAQIGVAIAAYFPTLTLSGTASVVGRGLAHWFSLPALSWAYGPQIAETLFDGGLRSATVLAARHTYYADVASYRQIVLAAFQQVEDDLASLRILKQEADVDAQAVASARLALRLTINQYKSGIVPYATVLTSLNAAFAVEQNAVTVAYLRMTSAVGLITALGGGWDHCKIACAGG